MADDYGRIYDEFNRLSRRMDRMNAKINTLAEETGKELVFVPEKYELVGKKEAEEEIEVATTG